MFTEGFSTFARARGAILRHTKISLAVLTVIFAGMITPTAAMAAGHEDLLGSLFGPTGEISSPTNRVMSPRPAGVGAIPQQMQFSVTNNNLPLPLLGKNIDFVRISLPSAAGFTFPASGLPDKSGWTKSVVSDPGDQFIDFRANSDGDEIAPGESSAFPISVFIARPRNDTIAPFILSVSSDGGDTFEPVAEKTAGALEADVRILSIKSFIPFQPNIARGTEGQLVKLYHTVINEGSVQMRVTPTVSSGLASDLGELTVFPYQVPSATNRTEQVWVRLGEISGTADKTAVFSAGAIGTPTTSLPTDVVSTVPVNVARNYTIQQTAALTVGQFSPVNANAINNYSFSASVTKTSTAPATVNSGTLTFVTGTAGAPIAVPGMPTANLLNAPTSTAFATGTQNRTFNFSSVNFSAPGLADGVYDAKFVFSTTDHNGSPMVHTQILQNVLTLDVVGPVFDHVGLELPNDRDGDRTTAVRNGVTLTVTGTVTGATAVSAAGLQVLDAGNNVLYVINSSSPQMTSLGGGKHNFTAVIPASAAVFNSPGVSVRPTATAVDAGGNSSIGIGGSITPIDNFKPTLSGVTATVEPPFVAGKNPVIRLGWIDNNRMIGGCDPLSYSLISAPTGVAVKDVVYSNGADCVEGAAGPADNVRVLVLTGALNRSQEPGVKYEDSDARDPAPAGNNPLVPPLDDDAKDAAGAFASVQQIQSVSRLVPNAPVITDVTRSGQGVRESARQDGDGVYYTRLAGTDLRVTVARDLGITDDRLQVKIYEPSESTTTGTVGDTQAGINVALTNDLQQVDLSFVSEQGVLGEVTTFFVQFDNVAPTQNGSTRNGSIVTATFTEEIVGTDSASHWSAFETVNGSSNARTVRSVSGSGASRTLDIAFTNTGSQYFVRYRSGTGTPYQDLAGNLLASPTTWPTTT